MYQHYLLWGLALIYCLQLNAQCPTGDVTFTSQSDVDAFTASFSNCTIIEGDLQIGSYTADSDISDISGLSNLTFMDGNLLIIRNPDLTTLSGLQNITAIDGRLLIQQNASLLSIEALQNIADATINNLRIINNPQLSICELNNICDYLSNCNKLATISGNASGCSKREEVAMACGIGTTEGTLAELIGLPIDFYEGTITNFRLSDDGTRLFVARTLTVEYDDKELVVNVFEWDGTEWIVQGQSPPLQIGAFDNWFTTAFSANGEHIAVNWLSQYDWTNHYGIRVYEWQGGGEWQRIGEDFPGSGTHLSLSADGNRLASASNRYYQHTGTTATFEWNGNEWAQIGQDFMGDHSYANLDRAILSPDGSRLAIDVRNYAGPPSSGGRLRLYEWSGTQWEPMAYDDPDMVHTVFHSFDGTGDHMICSSGNKRKFYAWNGSSWVLENIIDDQIAGNGDWQLSADAKRLYTNLDSRLFYWDGTAWNESSEAVFSACDLDSRPISFSGDGKRIAMSSSNSIMIYALESDGFVYEFPPVCVDSEPRTFEQAVSSVGGSFSGSGVNPGSEPGSFVFDPAIAGIGTHTVTYTLGSDTYTDSITVVAPIAPNLTMPDTLWLSSPGLRYIPGTGTPLGGVYQDSQGFLEDDGNGETFSLVALPPIATTNITYTIEDANGCTVSIAQMVTLINESPNGGGPQINQIGEDLQGKNADGKFGFSVSLSADGSRLAVGDPDTELGEVYLYHWEGDEWVQKATLIARYWQEDFGYDLALSGDGNRLIVGDPNTYYWDYYGGYTGGFFQVYEWDGVNWISLGPNYSFYSDFWAEHRGGAVDISYDGSVIVVGKSSESYYNTVYTYRDNGAGLNRTTIYGDANWGRYFGTAVSLSADGNHLVISEPANEENPASAPGVKVYEWDGSGWSQIGQTIAQPAWGFQRDASLDIAVDGSRIVIGSPQMELVDDPGYVQVYDWNGTSWVQVGTDLVGSAINEHFGKEVTLSTDGLRLIVGAPNNGMLGDSTGRAVLYEWDGTDWQEVEETLFGGDQAYDQFGFSVAASADAGVVAIGAIQENNTYGGGYVRVFAPSSFEPAFDNDLQPICANADPISDMMGGYPFGGVYSGPGVTDNGDGRTFTFNPSVAGPGEAMLLYQIDTFELTNTIEVLELPALTLDLPDTLYVASGMPEVILGSGLPIGGVYESTSDLFSDAGDGINLNYSGEAGFSELQTISYTYTSAEGCTNTLSEEVVVIDLNLIEECLSPTALSVSNISQITARFAWEQPGDGTSYWEVEIVEEGNLPTGVPTQTNIPNPYLFWSGGMQNTSYEVYVRSACGEDASEWVGPLEFTTHPGCGDVFYDLGGPDGNHPAQQFNRWIFCPDNAEEMVRIDFTDIDLGPFTELNIRNGNTGSSPMLLFDIINPVAVASSAANGCLTVEFASSSDTTAAGWEAQVSCIPALHCGIPFYDEGGPDANYSAGIDTIWTICPQEPGEQVMIQFTEVAIAEGDRLSLVPGSSYPTLNEEYLSTDLREAGDYISNYEDGCVTIHFTSAADSPGAAGWSASIDCVPTPACERPKNVVIEESLAGNGELELHWYAMYNIYPIELEVVPMEESPTGVATVTDILSMPYLWADGAINQGYDFYLRGKCAEGNYTDWAGPYTYQIISDNDAPDLPGSLLLFPNPT